MNDLFKDYGVEDKSIQQLIEEFALGLMLKGLPCPTRIVLPKQALDAYNAELAIKSVPPQPSPGTVINTHTSSGKIEIVEG